MSTTYNEYICVTNWEKVEPDDFYLTDDWAKTLSRTKLEFRKLRKRAKDGELYLAYVVSAVNFCIYRQMDAHQIIIDDEENELVSCESAIIDNEKEACWEYEF